MSASWRRAAVLVALTFVAALAGVLVGRSLSTPAPEQPNALHELLHEELKLDAGQRKEIEAIEARFAIRRKALELELRADNARLAAAIEAEHGYGPRVTEEIERSHRAMGELQKETLSHVFAMRSVLKPEQARKFDDAVVKALTASPE